MPDNEPISYSVVLLRATGLEGFSVLQVVYCVNRYEEYATIHAKHDHSLMHKEQLEEMKLTDSSMVNYAARQDFRGWLIESVYRGDWIGEPT